MSWVQKQMLNGVNPRTLLGHLMGDTSHVPTQVDDLTLWKVILILLSKIVGLHYEKSDFSFYRNILVLCTSVFV